MEISVEKSEHQALLIQMASGFLFELDVDYLKTCLAELRKHWERYDATAPLNRAWSPDGSAVLKAQVETLDHLIKYIECSKEVDKAKMKHTAFLEATQKMSKIFGI